VKPYRGPPMTLGNAAAAQARLIVWCRDCRHQIEPDPAERAQLRRRYPGPRLAPAAGVLGLPLARRRLLRHRRPALKIADER